MIHRAKRRDANEAAIVEALRAIGCSVHIVDQGDGLPDLLVGFRGETLLVEAKNPNDKAGAPPGGERHKGRGRRTAAQVKFREGWKGRPIIVAVSPEEAVAAVEAAAPSAAVPAGAVLYRPSEADAGELERRLAGKRRCHEPVPPAPAGTACQQPMRDYRGTPVDCPNAASLQVDGKNLCSAHAWCRRCQQPLEAAPEAPA